MARGNLSLLDIVFARYKERGQSNLRWFPYPFLISFVLVLVITSHVLLEENPRIGNPAKIIRFDAKPEVEGSIWLSVSLDGDNIVVTTQNRKVIRLPLVINNLDQLRPLTSYLKKECAEVILSASLSKKIAKSQAMVVLAIDHQLRFIHLRPILTALAATGISAYAFETLISRDEKSHG